MYSLLVIQKREERNLFFSIIGQEILLNEIGRKEPKHLGLVCLLGKWPNHRKIKITFNEIII